MTLSIAKLQLSTDCRTVNELLVFCFNLLITKKIYILINENLSTKVQMNECKQSRRQYGINTAFNYEKKPSRAVLSAMKGPHMKNMK